MERRIKERFSDAILDEAMRRYGVAQDRIRPLGGFESFIYEFARGPETFILRIGHSLRRSEPLIQGEVDWINYLAAGGAPVAQAIRSEGGKLVEPIDDAHGGHFLATAFVKARGRPPWEAGWTPELFETYGHLLGKMHALSKDYQPSDRTWKRPAWDDALMLDVERNLPASEAIAVEKYRALVDHVQSLPRDRASYGLVHFDAHAENLFVDDVGTITLFDFDDCTYSWFIYDIAIVLFYKVMGGEDVAASTRAFMTRFLHGYRRENRLDARWLQEIPRFLKMREIDLYAVIHRSFDVDNLDDWWCARYMHGRKYRIEHDVPYIDFDFASLAGEL